MKDNFSQQAKDYAKYRPAYPKELFDYIIGFIKEKNLAWDCGTGSGQSAIEICKHFNKVYATDISQKQLDNATKKENITYVTEPAEETTLHAGTVDLITISQALHWFNFEKFYDEVRRVAKKEALIAAWTYSLLRTDPATDALIYHYHYETLKNYWDGERKYVDEEYKNIPFPFKQISDPGFVIKLKWNLHDLEGYLHTWSALQKFIAANNYNPVPSLIEMISKNWHAEEQRDIVFPIHLKMGYIHS